MALLHRAPTMPLLHRAPASLDSLERGLLRKGVGERDAGARRCHDCNRTPLIGERVYLYGSDRVACELCMPLRGDEPQSWELVHGPAHGHAVRVLRVG